VLRHTTEEVHAACVEATEPERVEITKRLRDQVMNELGPALSKHDWFAGFDIAYEQPIKYSLQQWIDHVKETEAVVFIAGIFPKNTNLVEPLWTLLYNVPTIAKKYDQKCIACNISRINGFCQVPIIQSYCSFS
jgi:hypothetical protein